MAPTEQQAKKYAFKSEAGKWGKPKGVPSGVKKKRKWVPDNKVFQGSIKEGQGFALMRKQKVQHEYNKLLRKEKRKGTAAPKPLFKDEYPEHLKHLYLAEEEKLRQEAWTNRVNRSKVRMRGKNEAEDDVESDAEARQAEAGSPDPVGAEQTEEPVSEEHQTTAAAKKESLPVSNRMKKKMQRKTSYQKSKEEFERIKEKRRQKKEEYLRNKQQREEAIQRYKKKKTETFQVLSRKTKKGQPNLNIRMELLLQKIQDAQK